MSMVTKKGKGQSQSKVSIEVGFELGPPDDVSILSEEDASHRHGADDDEIREKARSISATQRPGLI